LGLEDELISSVAIVRRTFSTLRKRFKDESACANCNDADGLMVLSDGSMLKEQQEKGKKKYELVFILGAQVSIFPGWDCSCRG
jgi:hypothetical protein